MRRAGRSGVPAADGAGGAGGSGAPTIRYNGGLPIFFSAAMFTPSSHDVRRFFCEAYRKQQAGEILGPMEAIAADWIANHPEYAGDLGDAEAAIARDYAVETGKTNPFLHLSMHLSISEQISIDQPPGIRDAFNSLEAKLGQHEAQHRIMECLGEMIWTSQRNNTPPDAAAYLECVKKGIR
ncbi:MAG: hypothetical protein JWP59_2637 [Massilia sp.]|nr:hypothetical protein [Massilia sp.]